MAMQVLLTGPIQGNVELSDGRVIDVTADLIELDEKDVAEVCHRIAMRFVTEGHPNLVEIDPATEETVQRPFEYEPPEAYAEEMENTTPVGTPREEG